MGSATQGLSPAMQRMNALSEYIDKLGLAKSSQAVPETLTCGNRKVELESWQREVLSRGTEANRAAQGWANLLAESIAFEVKCQDLLDPQKQRRPNGDAVSHFEELIVDTAVGVALLEESQRIIDGLVVAGEVRSAKRLTGFRNRLSKNVGGLKDLIGPDAFARAENKGQGMVVTRAAQTGTSKGARPRGAWEAAPKKNKKKAKATEAGPITFTRTSDLDDATDNRKLTHKIVALVVAFVVWAIVMTPRALQEEAYVLQHADFSDLPAIVDIKARPPSVFVEVDDFVWDDLNRSEKKELVQRIGEIVMQADYNGAQIRTTKGSVVARWLKRGGGQLADS